MSRISIEQFRGYTDLPAYGREKGWCYDLTNMRLMPGGYLEARGGMEKLTIGAAADVATAGIVTGAHEHTLPNIGWIVLATTGGTVYSTNKALFAWFDLWLTTAVLNDAIYIGSDFPFSRVVFNVGQGAVTSGTDPTFLWEYSASGGTWASLTMTTSPNFTTVGEEIAEWATPSSANWFTTTANNVRQFWVRVRISAITVGITTKITQKTQRIYSDWRGNRQLYLSVADGLGASNNAAVKRLGDNGTTVTYTSVDSSLFSGNNARMRFASYRGALYYVNGKDQRRWNQDAGADMGFTKPTSSGITLANSGTGLTGVFIYALTYGYGPAGEWGESNEVQSPASAALANNGQLITFNLTNLPASGIVDYVYVYRTADLASMTSDARTAAPMYRIATVTRNADGTMPTTYTDNTAAFPFPPRALNIAVNTPPIRCRFIAVHKNRVFIGSNNQYPGRVWWSEPFQAEAFITDENFADFTRQTGGIITGLIEFNDQVVVFTEDQMFGIANVDTDVPDIYIIHPSVGSIAPDAVASGANRLMWLARDGVYLWNGNDPPERVSDDVSATFGKLSFEKHVQSRAIIHNRMYTVLLISSLDRVANASAFRYDLVTNSWSLASFADSTISNRQAPFIVISAPLGHSDAGVRHPLWAPADNRATVWPVYLGEQTTIDNATGFSLSVKVHMGPTGYASFSPDRIAAYYDNNSGLLADPSFAMNAAFHWATPALATGYGDAATDYQLVEVNASEKTAGSGAIFVTWSATTKSGGTLNGQRLHAIFLDGDLLEPIRRSG